MVKPGQSATDIGRHFKATAEEINRLLKEQGFTYGSPGAYGLTPKGAALGIQEHHQRGNGGYLSMNPCWEQTYWDESIKGVLKVRPDRLAKVRADIAADRLARSAASKAAQIEADTAFLTSQARRASETTSTTTDPQKLLLCVGGVARAVGIGYGICTVSPLVKRMWHEETAPGLSKWKDRIAAERPEPDIDADPLR